MGMAIQRAEDKTQAMQARAGAIDELMASGALETPPDGKDSITVELERMAADNQVDTLAAMKAELGGAEAPAAVTGASRRDSCGHRGTVRRRHRRDPRRGGRRAASAPAPGGSARRPGDPVGQQGRSAGPPWRATGTPPIGA